METRVITLEVRTDQIEKSIDRMDRSITDLRIDVDKKFHWMLGVQISSFLAIMAYIGKATNQF